MIKSVIGIVGKPSMESDMWHYMEICDDIRYALIKNGALAVGILPTDKKNYFKYDDDLDNFSLSNDEIKDLENLIEKFDGIILQGGLVRNKYEEEIANICIKKDIPIIGICAGFNNLIRALGGKVHRSDNTFHNQFGSKIAHEVDIFEDSKLFSILKAKKLLVNSIHNFVAKEEDIKGYKIVAKCPVDNTVEAIELEKKRFVMGIKWHPELMDDMNSIFEEFVKECSNKYE